MPREATDAHRGVWDLVLGPSLVLGAWCFRAAVGPQICSEEGICTDGVRVEISGLGITDVRSQVTAPPPAVHHTGLMDLRVDGYPREAYLQPGRRIAEGKLQPGREGARMATIHGGGIQVSAAPPNRRRPPPPDRLMQSMAGWRPDRNGRAHGVRRHSEFSGRSSEFRVRGSFPTLFSASLRCLGVFAVCCWMGAHGFHGGRQMRTDVYLVLGAWYFLSGSPRPTRAAEKARCS
jgi:hypothetical protein